MKFPHPRPRRRMSCGLAIVACLDLAAAEPAPARVEKPIKEAELTKVTLTPEAARRLGLTTAPVESRILPRTRIFGGEVTVPASTAARSAGQSVFTILPVLSPAEQVRLAQSQIEADGQVEQARVQLEGAQLALRRAEQMRRDKVGTERTVDETRVQVGQAEAGLRTAEARRGLLGPAILEAASPAEVWVRVPVYVGDLPKIDRNGTARVGGFGGGADVGGSSAVPVDAPPSANPAAFTVDLFYRLPNPDRAFRLGQRVGVTLPLRQEGATLTAPWSAIVYDAEGGTWLYEQTDATTFARRRVQVERAVDGMAVLAGGVRPGARVAATGAAELFGVEFGVGK